MKIGSKFKIGWQQYKIVGTSDYWSTTGRYIEMVVYEAPCADCGQLFRYPTTKTNLRSKLLNRRCPKHKSPGHRVPIQKPAVKQVVKRPEKAAKRVEVYRTRRSAPDLSYLD